MIKPFVGDFRLSQAFGMNPDMYKRYGYLGHNGMDWATPTGTPILAPISGTVIESANDITGYGLYIKIENDKEGSVLGHNKTLLVKVGDKVTEGQKIAISDNTGYSTGPHIHWGYYTLPRDRTNGYEGFIDQAKLLGSGMYKGYDLNNPDSMKIAVDILVEIMEGKYIFIDEHNKIINELDAKSTAQATTYAKEKSILEEKINTLEEVIQKLQDTEHTWSDTADVLQRKLKAVLEAFLSAGISLSTESDASVLAGAVSLYITEAQEGAGGILGLSQQLTDTLKMVEEQKITIAKLKKKDISIRTITIGKYIIKFFKNGTNRTN